METTTPTSVPDQDDFLAQLMAISPAPETVPLQENGEPLPQLGETLDAQEIVASTNLERQEPPLSKPSQDFQVQEMEQGCLPLPLVLLRWQSSGKPVPSIACVRCQASMWINRSDKSLENYCRAMHLITWASGDPEDLKDCQGLEMSQ